MHLAPDRKGGALTKRYAFSFFNWSEESSEEYVRLSKSLVPSDQWDLLRLLTGHSEIEKYY